MEATISRPDYVNTKRFLIFLSPMFILISRVPHDSNQPFLFIGRAIKWGQGNVLIFLYPNSVTVAHVDDHFTFKYVQLPHPSPYVSHAVVRPIKTRLQLCVAFSLATL